MPRRPHRLVLLAVLVAQLALGASYALRTPLWQVPDEPAHYNYIAQIADGTPDPPEMAPGDYPHAYLESLKAERFPPGRSIAPLAYEDYQPPAYYYLAAPVFAVAGPDVGDRVRMVRLLGAMLATLTTLLGWLAGRLACPRDETVATATAAFVGFLPMHLAMTAAVSNEPLAYLVSAGLLCLALGRSRHRVSGRGFVVAGAALLALGLLTKVSTYPFVAVLVAAEALAARARGPADVRAAALRALAVVGIAVVVAGPWFVRNMHVYGLADPLGTRAHDLVVVNQPRTTDWIATYGVGGWLRRLAGFSFQSFWGVFGWLGVFLDGRIYAALAVATACAAAGCAAVLVRAARTGASDAGARAGELGLLLLAAMLSAALFLAYNLRFVQHQGRYLFPALVPCALLFVLGLRRCGLWAAAAAGTARPARSFSVGAMYGFGLALALLAWIALTRYIVPGLS